VDGAGSRSCPVAGFVVSGVELPVSETRKQISIKNIPIRK
jgi:hypothetical protein